jgi:hypothetical protein
MSFKAVIASAGGNDTVLAKSFVIASEDEALAWYSMLRPSSVYSWEDLRDKIIAIFKGFTTESLTSTDLFQCNQNQGEALWDYFHRFVQLKAKAPNVLEDVEKPTTIEELYSEFEKYCRSDNDLRRRLEEQNQNKQYQGSNKNAQRGNIS